MSSTTTILLPILAGFGLLLWSSFLSDEEDVLKLIFRLFFIPCVWLSLHIATLYAALDYAADSQLVQVLADITFYLGYILIFVGIYYLFLIMKKIYEGIMSKKTQESGEKYD